MLSDPKSVREVFQGDPDALHSGEANALFTATVGHHSVLVLDEHAHEAAPRLSTAAERGPDAGIL